MSPRRLRGPARRGPGTRAAAQRAAETQVVRGRCRPSAGGHSPHGALCTMALSNRPRAAGKASWAQTLKPPNDSPNRVTLWVSPPNAPMLARTRNPTYGDLVEPLGRGAVGRGQEGERDDDPGDGGAGREQQD